MTIPPNWFADLCAAEREAAAAQKQQAPRRNLNLDDDDEETTWTHEEAPMPGQPFSVQFAGGQTGTAVDWHWYLQRNDYYTRRAEKAERWDERLCWALGISVAFNVALFWLVVAWVMGI